jgi:hypothetical protein
VSDSPGETAEMKTPRRKRKTLEEKERPSKKKKDPRRKRKTLEEREKPSKDLRGAIAYCKSW